MSCWRRSASMSLWSRGARRFMRRSTGARPYPRAFAFGGCGGRARRRGDALALRHCVGIALDEYTPDHSTISRARRLIDVDTHREVFSWVLGVLADRGLLQGKRIAIDATTLEANAAMRSIVRRDSGESYGAFLGGLDNASGTAT